MKKSLSELDIDFIKRNYLTMSGSDMAYFIGIGKGIVYRWARENSYNMPKSIINQLRGEKCKLISSSTPQIDKIIIENYLTIPIKPLAHKIGRSDTFLKTRLRQLNLKIPPEIIEQRKRYSRLKPGNVPPNKGKKITAHQYEKSSHTFFKKGALPKNTLSDGIITIRRRYNRKTAPYKWIRIGKGKWEMLHRYNWILKYGPIPEGMIVVFKTKDTMNCDISNLELITLKENMSRNTIARFTPEIKSVIHLLNKARKLIKDHEVE